MSLSLSPTSGSYFFYFAIQTSTLNTFICVCHPLSLLEHALGHDAVYQGDSAYMNITFPRFQRLLARVHKSCFKSTLMSGKVNDEPFPLGTMCELAALWSNISPRCKITCFIRPLSLQISSLALMRLSYKTRWFPSVSGAAQSFDVILSWFIVAFLM